MSRPVLALLALMAVVAATSFWWQSEQAARQDAATTGQAAPAARPAEQLILTQEAVDALATENAELQSRIRNLEARTQDADRLLELKTARLQKLENPAGNQ